MAKTYREKLGALGLTYPQFLVLTILWEADALSLTAIGQRIQLDSGTLTPLVKRLETAGFVTRSRRSTDEREIEIALTPQGQALKSEALSVRQHVTGRVALADSDVVRLRAELFSIVNTLLAPLEEAR